MNTLNDLAQLASISSSYIDKTGKEHQTDDAVRRFFLKSMGIPAQNDAEIKASLTQLSKKPLIEDTLAFYDNEEITININDTSTYELSLIDENQNIILTQNIAQTTTLPHPPKHGYYHLILKKDDTYQKESLLIYAPKQCYQPEFIKNKQHIYGVSLMLYALRSKNSMGIGDFSDLKEIIKLTAKSGGDIVGINPLGVMSPSMLPSPVFFPFKGDVSPYRSLSRLFYNYIYLDLTSEPDYQNSDMVQELVKNTELKNEIYRLNNSDNVIYSGVSQIKLRILNLMYKYFIQTEDTLRFTEFNTYKNQKGSELYNLCTFEALLETHQQETFWRYWQDGCADIKSPVIKQFQEKNADRTDFYAYCHWLADKQLRSLQDLAKSLGMKIGLYADMPIGAASNGAEVWENPKAYVLDAGIGAPADPMRPRGQSWGFTPYHPLELPKQHYQPFIKLVQENMAIAGALRIDHAMGLRRLFWGFFTPNNPVVQGCYIYYDIKVLTAILTLESHRTKCLVIGEDLGTVPAGFREYMAEHGLLSYKVFFRQKEKNGTFIAPKDYMYMSLAQSSTHDQATSYGFWKNEDIEVFKNCGLYVNDEQYQSNLDTRRQDRENMLKAFNKEHILSDELQNISPQSIAIGDPVPQNLEKAVNIYGAKTNSALYLVRLCDIYTQTKLDNAPGTIDEYPNWRLKLNISIEDIKNGPVFEQTLNQIKDNRP